MGAVLGEAVEAFARATDYMLEALGRAPSDALAGATPYLRLFGLARGGTALADLALASHHLVADGDDRAHSVRIATARFFAKQLATGARGLETSIVEGAESVMAPALLAAE